MAWAAVALALALAFWNGANDNGKGVASLLAYGAATPRRALAWAGATTALGAGLSAVWGRELLAAFRAGFVDGGDGLSPAFFVAVLAAAGGSILLATRFGMPVSVAGRRVLATLGERVTRLPLGESLTASAASSLLVGLASFRGLPLSTTHVTAGAIVGAGVASDPRAVRWRVVRDIVLAWLVTLPAAALLAALAQALLG